MEFRVISRARVGVPRFLNFFRVVSRLLRRIDRTLVAGARHPREPPLQRVAKRRARVFRGSPRRRGGEPHRRAEVRVHGRLDDREVAHREAGVGAAGSEQASRELGVALAHRGVLAVGVAVAVVHGGGEGRRTRGRPRLRRRRGGIRADGGSRLLRQEPLHLAGSDQRQRVHGDVLDPLRARALLHALANRRERRLQRARPGRSRRVVEERRARRFVRGGDPREFDVAGDERAQRAGVGLVAAPVAAGGGGGFLAAAAALRAALGLSLLSSHVRALGASLSGRSGMGKSDRRSALQIRRGGREIHPHCFSVEKSLFIYQCTQAF